MTYGSNRQGYLGALIVLCACSFVGVAQAALYDNRYWPLYQKPWFLWQQTPDSRGFLSARALFLGSDSSYEVEDDELGVFGFLGSYNEIVLNSALQKAGLATTSFLPPTFDAVKDIPWTGDGKIALRGCMVEGEFWPISQLSLGGSLFAGQMTNDRLPLLLAGSVTPPLAPGDADVVRAANARMQEVDDASPQCYRSGALFGDINLFVKGHFVRDYWYKFHCMDISCALGVLAPTSVPAPLSNPAAFPVGYDGLVGVYAQFDVNAILKSELSTGFSLQFCQRVPKTATWRMPIETEPTQYGVGRYTAKYKPGLTIAFYPYVQIGGLRDGFGLGAGYYMVHHFSDDWSLCGTPAVAPNLDLLRERSVWGRDHFTFSLLYDFGYECDAAWYRPLVSLSFDIPWKGPVTERVPKTHAISVRIESRI